MKILKVIMGVRLEKEAELSMLLTFSFRFELSFKLNFRFLVKARGNFF